MAKDKPVGHVARIIRRSGWRGEEKMTKDKGEGEKKKGKTDGRVARIVRRHGWDFGIV